MWICTMYIQATPPAHSDLEDEGLVVDETFNGKFFFGGVPKQLVHVLLNQVIALGLIHLDIKQMGGKEGKTVCIYCIASQCR